MIISLAVSGYRSLRDIVLPLEQLTVITGANGAGKSSLYRALRLLSEVAQGQAIASLAREGGLVSTLWAGPEQFSRAMRAGEQAVTGTIRKDVVALKLGFASDDYGYALDLGLPVTGGGTAFGLDPEIKTEAAWIGERLMPRNVFAERRGQSVRARDAGGHWTQIATRILPYDSMVTQAIDPRHSAELLILRDRMRGWRFYDHLRTDRDAPARRPVVGTRTVALAGDGGDLASAIQTIREIGDGPAFDQAIEDAFPGAEIEVVIQDSLFSVRMHQEGLLRALEAGELSDGTLRFVLLAAALLSPRPPELMVLNEPETSLHPSLMPALARLISAASRYSQIIVVTHNDALNASLAAEGARLNVLYKELGETRCDTDKDLAWAWMKR